MKYDLYQKYLKEYALEALQHGDDVSQAADYLQNISDPPLFARHRQEKREALHRAQKVFDESRSRPPWIVLKSLGLDEAAKDYL